MRRMKHWFVVCTTVAVGGLVGAGALAQDADEAPANNESWIPLEDLPVDDQGAALDAAEGDQAKQAAVPAWSGATDQLVVHALFQKALSEVGADLLPGTP